MTRPEGKLHSIFVFVCQSLPSIQLCINAKSRCFCIYKCSSWGFSSATNPCWNYKVSCVMKWFLIGDDVFRYSNEQKPIALFIAINHISCLWQRVMLILLWSFFFYIFALFLYYILFFRVTLKLTKLIYIYSLMLR